MTGLSKSNAAGQGWLSLCTQHNNPADETCGISCPQKSNIQVVRSKQPPRQCQAVDIIYRYCIFCRYGYSDKFCQQAITRYCTASAAANGCTAASQHRSTEASWRWAVEREVCDSHKKPQAILLDSKGKLTDLENGLQLFVGVTHHAAKPTDKVIRWGRIPPIGHRRAL